MSKLFPFWYLKYVPYICPSGEQVGNGGFEDANLVPWISDYASPYTPVFTPNCHSGILAITNNLFFNTYWLFSVSQTLDNIPAECISEISFWYYQYVYANRARLRVTYTDDTYTQVLSPTVGSWAQMLLTPTAEKIIKKITAYCTGGHTIIDDVSLIGTGLAL